MSMKTSVVYTAANPRAELDGAVFAAGVETLRKKGVSVIEFYSPFATAAQRGKLLAQQGMESIFLAALYQKRHGFNLSALNEDIRALGIQETKRCIDAAAAAGSGRVLMTSGALPEDPSRTGEAVAALESSLICLCDYAADRGVALTLEPGDRTVQAMQVVGPTFLAVELCERIRQRGRSISLTMDSSHLAQLGEDIRSALELAKPYCNHIHLANCILDLGHPMYGDKHPLFTDPAGYFSLAELQSLGRWCKTLYAEDELTLSFEIICHDSADAGFFSKVLREEEWFFSL